jgi:diguanylate cyclase (GGDEF)-like protein/PAS domain S-box-containing protein/putative nucleotidyltransferase with HDIG domain
MPALEFAHSRKSTYVFLTSKKLRALPRGGARAAFASSSCDFATHAVPIMSAEPTADAIQSPVAPLAGDPALSADTQLGDVTTLLSTIDPVLAPPARLLDSAELALENQLVQVRLGIASSLFAGLRAKHAPTAHHSLRVALSCSAWGGMLGLSDADRDELEVAALLHDIGKVGVPDTILLKPAPLTADEYHVIERHRQVGADILRWCCASDGVMEIVQSAGAWFDGSREGHDLSGEQLPLGARLVAIVDAWDAMTSDQVYRRALAHERALAELFEFAGTQFDPRLVQEFCSYAGADQVKLQSIVARRWLKELQLSEGDGKMWQLSSARPSSAAAKSETLFYRKLLESMHDAVLFIDSSLKIMLWNRAAERLTGIPAASIEHKHWTPSLVNLRDEKGRLLAEEECPVIHAIRSGVQTLRRLSVMGRTGQRIDIDAHLVPIHGKNGVNFGAAVHLHDASSQITLEQRIQSLHEQATRDPLTQVANRAEFDRIMASAVDSHLERRIPCSLILCDIDHFKRINDNFGHQPGDEVLVTFAALLRRHCRSGDLVARYGGEEFVMLCADCDNATATRRAEELRVEVADFPMEALGGKSITASFGVTEVQSGDTPETMLRRADRAMYQAKANGRNTVVQLGSGIAGGDVTAKRGGWFSWLRPTAPELVLERTLGTSVPFNVVVEKLRGFVADHHAQIDTITANYVVLRIEGDQVPSVRRVSDRPVPFVIEIRFEESEATLPGSGAGKVFRTIARVSIRPQRTRDRRRRDVLDRAQRLAASLKSYLVAQDYDHAQAASA